MKEMPGGIEHPPLNFAMRPDLGGTQFPFVKEVSRDSTEYIKTGDLFQARLLIPKHKDFVHASLENHEGNKYIEAFYNRKGKLTSANLWFRSYCERINFQELGNPDEVFWEAYAELFENRMELMLEVDIPQNMMGIHYCTEDSTFNNPHDVYSIDNEIVSGLSTVSFDFEDGTESQPISLYTNLGNHYLTLGFQIRDDFVIRNTISTFASPKKLFKNPTPANVREFTDSIFKSSPKQVLP